VSDRLLSVYYRLFLTGRSELMSLPVRFDAITMIRDRVIVSSTRPVKFEVN